MSGIRLYDYQEEAVGKMKNGCILCGGVGSGKSRTSLAYYFVQNGGKIDSKKYSRLENSPKDLYIITTAMKRDKFEWEEELHHFFLSTHPDCNLYSNKIIVDSWNNIGKYQTVRDAFFIFDEQRVIGKGAWVKAFLKITKVNEWILLSATPGDTWADYIPVFIANGFYKNRTQFNDDHIVWDHRVKFPRIDRYLNTGRLIRLRNNILVDMEVLRKTQSHHEDVYVSYDIRTYKDMMKTRWNIFENKPIDNATELCYLLRKIVNSDESRQIAVLELFEKHSRVIIFYNFDYELEILMNLYYGDDVEIAEWNGHKHQEIPTGKNWVYLVQYNAGAEGWNCIKTDTIIFYSQNYSYRILTQACGRIDRINTPYEHLYYYHIKSHSNIDMAINKALLTKKDFNAGRFVERWK